jgi:hypothetical protein
MVAGSARRLATSASAAALRAATAIAWVCTAFAAAILASGSPARPDRSRSCAADAARVSSSAPKSGFASRPDSSVLTSSSRRPAARSSSRSAGHAWVMSRLPSKASPTCVDAHSSVWTTLASP